MKRAARIAIIDDNYHLSENLKNLLVINDYGVDVYRTLARAEVGLANYKPDLIICDINLPDGKGHEIIRRIRSNTQFNLIPIIVLTGEPTANENELFALGVSELFLKPTEFSLLKITIQKLLNKRNEYIFYNKPFKTASKLLRKLVVKIVC